MSSRAARKEARNEAKRDNCSENRKRIKRGKAPMEYRLVSCKGGSRNIWRAAN